MCKERLNFNESAYLGPGDDVTAWTLCLSCQKSKDVLWEWTKGELIIEKNKLLMQERGNRKAALHTDQVLTKDFLLYIADACQQAAKAFQGFIDKPPNDFADKTLTVKNEG